MRFRLRLCQKYADPFLHSSSTSNCVFSPSTSSSRFVLRLDVQSVAAQQSFPMGFPSAYVTTVLLARASRLTRTFSSTTHAEHSFERSVPIRQLVAQPSQVSGSHVAYMPARWMNVVDNMQCSMFLPQAVHSVAWLDCNSTSKTTCSPRAIHAIFLDLVKKSAQQHLCTRHDPVRTCRFR